MFSCSRNAQATFIVKSQLKIIIFLNFKLTDISLVLYWVDLTNEIKNETSERLYGIILSVFLQLVICFLSVVYSEICPGGLHFLSFQWGPQHPLGSENRLKSIDFTRSGGIALIASPKYSPAFFVKLINKPLNDFD